MYSHPPTLTFDLTNLPSSFDTNLEADHMIERVQKIHEEIVKNLTATNSKYKAQADSHRGKATFQPGDLLMVYIKKIQITSNIIIQIGQQKI